MNLDKLKFFGELQSVVFKDTKGNFPLVTFYNEQHGVSVHNPFLDVSGRFSVDPVREYGEDNLLYMEKEVAKIEAEMGVTVKEMDPDDLRLYLGGKFYKDKEPSLECFKKITFDDEPQFMGLGEDSPINDTLNFYVPLFDGFEELFPEAALFYVTPVRDDAQVNLYLDYDIATKDISLSWVGSGDIETPELYPSGEVNVPEEVKSFLLEKMDAYVKFWNEESLEDMVSKVVNEEIWDALKEKVQEKWYAKETESGDFIIELSAYYNDTNEFLLETVYDNRNSVMLKDFINDAIHEAHFDEIIERENDLLESAGFSVDSPFYDIAEEMMHERICFEPDYDHFLNDDMKVNLLLATDWERNIEFTDIKDNLARWIDKEALAEMKADAEKYGTELREPDNALLWLVKQQGYSMEDLKKVNEAYKAFIYENYFPNGSPRNEDGLSYDKKIELLNDKYGKFLVSVCEAIDNQTYSMGCVTILLESSLREYCELFEREESENLVPKEIVIPKEAYLTLHNPWNGAGCMGWIELEKDLVVPNEMIYDSEIEGVKRDYGWTVDQISGLIGSCWKESKGVREPQESLDKKLKEVSATISQAAKEIKKDIQKNEHEH